MDYADRTGDRKSWTYAVQYDKDLYEHALRNYYRFLVVSRESLIRDQEEPADGVRNQERDLTELLRNVRPFGNQSVPLISIESLLLKCQYEYNKTEMTPPKHSCEGSPCRF